jgi:FKBP-type peptidyl-prolyl cis-trans isomerase
LAARARRTHNLFVRLADSAYLSTTPTMMIGRAPAPAAAARTTSSAVVGQRPAARRIVAARAAADDGAPSAATTPITTRRAALASAAAAAALLTAAATRPQTARAEGVKGYEPMAALKDKDYGKSRMRYPDYETTPSGLQYKELRAGDASAAPPKSGDGCVIDFDGYTIGYYGRPFEARNKPKGSSFVDDDKDYYRFSLGSGTTIPAIEEAVADMRPGAIRRLIVPVELGYPPGKNGLPDSRLKGPRPTTFAGQRALDFVLQNQGLIDKTLLFDVELVRVDRK